MKASRLKNYDRRFKFLCGQVRCSQHYACKWTPVTNSQKLFNQEVENGYFLVGVRTIFDNTKK